MAKWNNEARRAGQERDSEGPSVRKFFSAFLHLGLTAYGSLAMLEPIRRRIVKENGLLSQKKFLDGLALCQLLPGL